MRNRTNFRWGVATSAYQIEGGRHEGGKGESIWDRFSDTGRMPESGDVACDHYHRYPEDIALMADLGVDVYRFSAAWTRVIPDGDGAVNQAGLDFYSRLVDGMLDAGITPWLTLYHWDLPQALEDRGGWTHRDTAYAFARYTEVMVSTLGDRVAHWITHNEPWVSANLGYGEGVFAPGRTGKATALAAAHHILVSHGLATDAIRSLQASARVGIALDCRTARPASSKPEDVAAARYFDGHRNRWFFDPVFGLGYPTDVLETFVERGHLASPSLSFVEDGDMALIGRDIDFLGLNYYTTLEIAAGDDESEQTSVAPGPNPPDGYTEMGWSIVPSDLTGFLVRLAETYTPPSIVVTENGASFSDGPGTDGAVRDLRRIDYLDSHVNAVSDAIERGVPVDGYFVWSLLDNLEWTSGFSQRFGLVWVDHSSGQRTPKQSYDWYRSHIRSQKERRASDT